MTYVLVLSFSVLCGPFTSPMYLGQFSNYQECQDVLVKLNTARNAACIPFNKDKK
jgi:hypothetical protein